MTVGLSNLWERYLRKYDQRWKGYMTSCRRIHFHRIAFQKSRSLASPADCLHLLHADGGAQGAGDGFAETLDIGFLFGLDHNAGELLGSGEAQTNPAIFPKRGFP